MWNRNSRTWLVKGKTYTEWSKILVSQTLSRSRTRLNQRTSSPPRRTAHQSMSSQRRPGSASISGTSSRTPCLNQIVEVLLVILLANCLVQPLLAERARSSLGERLSYTINNNNNNNYNIEDFQSESGVLYLHRSQNFKISPKPCSIGRIEGTCMFVWECIKSEGRHVGMCVDSFMFGSCCAHNYTDNIIMPPAFSYTRPTKPVGISSFNHRPRPPHAPHKPSISGMTTIERPHGAGTLVIRPSGPHHQGALHRPSKAPTTSTTTSMDPPWSSNAIGTNDLQFAESIPSPFSSSSSTTNLWPSTSHTVAHQHWHMTTEPNFITKPRPPSSWDKPTPLRPKPSKPTKRPTTSSPAFHNHHHHQLPSSTSIVNSTRRPKPTTTTTKTTTPKHRPQQSQTHNSIRPSTKPTTVQNFQGSTTPMWTTSTTDAKSNSTTSIDTTTTTTTTTSKYRPSTLAPSNGVWSSTSTNRPSPSTSSSSASQSTQTLDPTTIESNEIGDGIPIVKTISAARGVECGTPLLTRPETRIVGGKSAAFGRWPWQVSVRRTSFFGFSSTHRCGGALINENWIATAGHCVDDLLTSQIRIRVGEYDFSHVQESLPYIERAVATKVVHPKYNFFTYEYDLALVKLEQPLEFAPHVSPICLPQTDSLLIGMNATVTGWGRLSEGGTLPSVLQEVAVPIVSNDNCKTMFLRAGRQEIIPDIFLCAGYEGGGQDSCQGDSGGPLQVKSQDGRFFLAGIISWGIGCAEANLPGVCTRISKFVPWILEHVA